jgi:hypothetical protein
LIFADLCHAAIAGLVPDAAGKVAFGLEIALDRLVAGMRAQYPQKPDWLLISEIVLHLSERLLGLTTQEGDLVAKIAVHRTRSAMCGTYSTPDFVADGVTKSVLVELRRSRMLASGVPAEVIDLSLEAGHFGLSLLGHVPLNPIHFYGLDRDPEAIDLASLLLRKAVKLSGSRSFRVRLSVADSILGPLPRGFPAAFDAVIGNPPWKTDHPTDRSDLFEMFHPMLTARFDVYLAFILRADALLRPGGLLGLVVPSGFMYNLNARRVRAHLLAHYELLRLDVYRRRTIIELPSVAPIAMVLRKRESGRVPRRTSTIVLHASVLGPNAHDTRVRRNVRDQWRRHPNSVFCHATDGGSAWAERKKGGVLLTELGCFSSGARLSAMSRVETPMAFVGFTASCLWPFHACKNKAKHYKRGDAAFERCPPLEYLTKPKVLFQTIRCVSLPQRLVAAAAGRHDLACSTTAMIIPNDAAHVGLIAALMNSTVGNAWYKTNDFNRAIKIEVLKRLPIPVNDALWSGIADVGCELQRAYFEVHNATVVCAIWDSGVEIASRLRRVYQRIDALKRQLDNLVFELYRVAIGKRASLIALSGLRTF